MSTRRTSLAPAPDAAPERLLTRPFVLLTLGDLAYFTAEGVAIYALPFYVTGPVGSDKAGAGLAFGAFAVTALVLRPWAGRLSDTGGRRPLLVGGALLCALSMALTAHVDTLALVVVLRMLLGVAEAAFLVASFAALADLAPASRLGEALSYNSLGLYLRLALGPPLGEIIVTTVGFTAAWWGAAALALVAAAVVARIGETRSPRRAEDGARPPLLLRKALPPSLGFFASVFAMGGFLAFASLHAAAIGLGSTSVPLLVYGSVVVTCRIAFAKVPDRLPSLPLGAAALVAIATGLTLMAIWQTPAGMTAGTAVMAVGVSFSTPAFFSAVFATVEPSERGAASGTMSAFLDLGIGAGPILLGVVAQSVGLPWMFGAAAAVALMGSTWTLSLASRTCRVTRVRPRASTADVP
ncbi:MFS transporter [Actinotalea sp. K2]|uniref:MFS transporter n=1 Tax=Actinotalea sp. K2 TaxID=2939438 RepID=UPI0020178C85|nr:MFS transporter [Actinotalea sp. K2]MCL3861132.1 MFS transporter [Actinotalea sp. K2]